MKFRKIEILEKDLNKKGDLFGRLMADFFHSLGYDEPTFNTQMPGRELDIKSHHRIENKIAIAECKAHATTIGGTDINKFMGALDAEKRELKNNKQSKDSNVVGYFISLSGFTATAIQQENKLGNRRVILVNSEKIVEELINGKILVSIEEAISSLSSIDSQLTLMPYTDLLAYDKGWVWIFYFSNSHKQQVSHFALVHAEGKPLIKDLAEEIISIDRGINNIFSGLTLLNNENSSRTTQRNLKETENKYFRYLENELGEIQFEGLPTDRDACSIRVKLENIFIPLHLNRVSAEHKGESNVDENIREGIGDILSKKTRLAILAKPGGGKSTLIKRIAISYAFPGRRKQINDNLPDKSWFPIFLRCRELGEKVTLSITDIINSIPSRAEIPAYANEFSSLVSQSLQNGNALILIDGLDEIAEDRNRIAFVNQLRTFLATYPTINIIVTSREAGFRVVGGSLATYCEHYRVSNLTAPEIKDLSIKWHTAIIDNTANTIREANKISEIIIKDRRISVLAENPLLLTTLLFVKRWAGYLPTKKNVLYEEMIKLLLVTWNVEGHEKLEIEEAAPQLAYVAYWMTKHGQQTITEEELNSCLIEARTQMPEILGYTNISPSEFIKRVESRSSLLIMSGHKKLASGSITAVYEFLHLSFQEYLTAKAVVKKYIPQEDYKDKIVDILKPNINSENWKEVIPLAAVLLERDTKDLIEYLIAESKKVALKGERAMKMEESIVPSLLGSCLANEIQINLHLLETAIEWYAKNSSRILDESNTEVILKSKFGSVFKKKVSECFFEKYEDNFSFSLGSMLAQIYLLDFENQDDESIPNEIFKTLIKGTREEKCIAILGMMRYSFRYKNISRSKKAGGVSNAGKIFNTMLELLKTNDKHFQFSISWCIAWAAQANILPVRLRLPYIKHLLPAWVGSKEFCYRRATSWALRVILTPTIPKDVFLNIPEINAAIDTRYSEPANEFDKLVAIFLGKLIGKKWNVHELEEEFKKHTLGGNSAKFALAFGIDLSEKQNKQ
jgi:hypothetical protein